MMTINEKIAFLMETIPSEKEVMELKRRFLFGGVETELLLDASRTLLNSKPDENLIEWAYTILQMRMEKRKNRTEERIPVQQKMERIIALFSNQEDLQRILQIDDWDTSDRRAIQLVSHFVANDIPLMSNFKIVDKVYNLLANSYIPLDIASKYFGKTEFEDERDHLLEKYKTYRRKKERTEAEEMPQMPVRESPIKRYTYLLSSLAALTFIFMAGFLTAKYLYDKPMTQIRIPIETTTVKAVHAADDNLSHQAKSPHPAEASLERQYIINRIMLERGLEDLGVETKIDFSTKVMAQMAGPIDLPDYLQEEKGLIHEPEPWHPPRTLAGGPLKIAIRGIGELHGLALPLPPPDRNTTGTKALPEGFRLEAEETPSSRIVYMTDNKNYYPVELYTFVGEPVIMEFRLINFKPGHYVPVPSDIWHFSDIGALRMHKHFIYQQGKISPAKIITNHFHPGGGSVELISVGKLDRSKRQHELLVERNDYLPSGKLLYQERYEIDRIDGRWRSRLVHQAWYDEGIKIQAKGLDTVQ